MLAFDDGAFARLMMRATAIGEASGVARREAAKTVGLWVSRITRDPAR
jgi:hypothetical protein